MNNIITLSIPLFILLVVVSSILGVIVTMVYLTIKNKNMVPSGVTVDIKNETVLPSVFDPDSICIIAGGRAAGKSYRKMINETDEHFIERILNLKAEDILKNNDKIPYTDDGVGPGYRSPFSSDGYRKAVEIINEVSWHAKEHEADSDDSENLLEVLSFMKYQKDMLENMTTKYSYTVDKYSLLVDKYSNSRKSPFGKSYLKAQEELNKISGYTVEGQ